MIKEKHLIHWMNEIEYARNGIETHLQKDGFKGLGGTMINNSHLSFEYLNEKATTIKRLLGCIVSDMKIDVTEETIMNSALFAGLTFGWASRLKKEDINIEQLITDMKEEAVKIAKYAGVDPLG